MTRLTALARTAAAATLCVFASCSSSSSTNVTAPTTTQCALTLASNSLNMGASGGDGALSISINRECSWNAKPDADWITLTSDATGQGTATVTFRVGANPTPSTRSGGIAVNDRRADITQSGGSCTYAINRTNDAAPSAGGEQTILVTAGPSCTWTAKSNAAWITIGAGASGTGSASVTIDIAPNTGLERSGTATIAGQTFTVTQSGPSSTPCTYSLSANSQSVGASSTTGSVTLTTGTGCAWSATADVPWLSITAGASGIGNGTVRFSVASNTDATTRAGTLTVGGQTFTVNQAAASASCSFSLSSTSVSASSAASSSSVDITTTSSCAWTAASNAAWIAVTSATSGTGNATVSFSIAANSDTTGRSGTLTIAGQTVTVSQQGAAPPPTCSITLSESALSIGPQKTDQSINVTASSQSCAWTASSDVVWMTIKTGASGTGNGTVAVHVDANPDHSPRVGTLTISGKTVTVTQAGKP